MRSRTIRGNTGKTQARLETKKKGLRRGKIRKAVVVCRVVGGGKRKGAPHVSLDLR